MALAASSLTLGAKERILTGQARTDLLGSDKASGLATRISLEGGDV